MPNCLQRRLASLIFACALAAAAAAPSLAENHDGQAKTAAANIKHVFLIVLENKTFSNTFGTSTQDPYLQKTLVPEGALLTQYYGTGHVSLDNYISMISGQAPTPDTDDDCIPGLSSATGLGNFNNVEQTGRAPDGQVVATGGCIYAKDIRTLPNQLEDAGLTWKGYMGDMGNDPTRESATCGHPTIGIGTDNTNEAEAPSAAVPLGDAYATRHDPFMYFHSIIDSPSCKTHVVNLNNLPADLKDERTTPNFVFITPNLCDDGHDGNGTGAAGTTCANGQPGGLTSIDAFLQKWVPQITASPAYKKDGLLVITFDESNYGSETVTVNPATKQETVDITFTGDTCCNQQPGPNLSGVRPSTATLVDTPALVENLIFSGYGGDQIGALLLSPFVKPGSTSNIGYNHYSLLRSLEDIFGIREHLGYAGDNPRQDYFLQTIGDDESIFKTKEECGFGSLGQWDDHRF
jgi:phosphatidylinositol-3-phosphatase